MESMLLPTVWLIAGMVGLVFGGEFLVRGASGLAAAARISPLVIGLTVVAFGTSAPELAVAVKASFAGQGDIALGNVVGSNIFNVLFILGISALIAPLLVSSQLIRIDVPLMVAASFAMLAVSADGSIGRVDGILLFGTLLVYVVWSVRQSRREQTAIQEEYAQEFGGPPPSGLKAMLAQIGLLIIGLLLLAVGANWLVEGAVDIARYLGMSELLIGLTIIAVGTSLPEVAASIVASLRGERDIAVGNVVGSNLFNILCVMGLSSIVSPAGIPVPEEALYFDLPVMVAVAVGCLPIFCTGHLIARWEGGLFFAYYIAYTSYLILAVTRPEIGQQFGRIMLLFVIPLTAVTLAIVSWRRLRQPRES